MDHFSNSRPVLPDSFEEDWQQLTSLSSDRLKLIWKSSSLSVLNDHILGSSL